jgi:hypothetical protein
VILALGRLSLTPLIKAGDISQLMALKGRLKMQDLFTQALGINSPWFIKDVSFDNKAKTIAIILLWREALSCQSPFTEYRESSFSEMMQVDMIQLKPIYTTGFLSMD